MRFLKGLLLVAFALYAGALAVLYVRQRDFLFPASAVHTAPAAAGLPQAEEVILETDDGERLIAWHVPPVGDKPVVLFFHGNGDTLAGRAPRFRELTATGVGLVAIAFRGYVGSSGHPNEQGLKRDASAAYAFARARYPATRLVPWGFSLGSGIAVWLAAQSAVGKLVLEAPYTSAVDVAAAFYPIFPVRLLMKDQLRSDELIGSVHVPLLILHGARDPGISITFGERLFALANEPKRFVRFPEGGHEDLDRYGAVAAVLAFLGEKTP